MTKILLPNEAGIRIVSEIQEGIRARIDPERDSPTDIAKILYQDLIPTAFHRPRRVEGTMVKANVIFAGSYFLDHATEEEARLEAKAAELNSRDPQYETGDLIQRLQDGTNHGHGCVVIPLNADISTMARAFRNGEIQNVSNTGGKTGRKKVWECDDRAKHNIVYPIMSQEPTSAGRYAGRPAIVAVTDMDFKDAYTIGQQTVEALGKILTPVHSMIYPGKPGFRTNSESPVYRPQKEPKKKNSRQTWPDGTEVRDTG